MVESGLDGGVVRGDAGGPADGDAGEGLGDEEAIPGAELPGSLGVDVEGFDGGACQFGQLDDAGLGDLGEAELARREFLANAVITGEHQR